MSLTKIDLEQQRSWPELATTNGRSSKDTRGTVRDDDGAELCPAHARLQARSAPMVRHADDKWIGPLEGDLKPNGVSLRGPVPPERWPYGLPSAHEDCCSLHGMADPGRIGGLYCDCAASAADDLDHGILV